MYYCASQAIYLFDYIYEFKELINSLKLTAHGHFGFSLWKHFKSTCKAVEESGLATVVGVDCFVLLHPPKDKIAKILNFFFQHFPQRYCGKGVPPYIK